MTVQKEQILELYKRYAPKNITLEQFEKIVDQDPKLLDDIGGEFSTFNITLSKASKKLDVDSTNDFRQKLTDSIDEKAAEQVALEYAKMYEEIICSDDFIIDNALKFDSLGEEERQNLARKIIQGINKYFNIDSDLEIEYQDRYEGEEKPEVKQHKIKLIDKFLKIFKRKYNKNTNYGLAGRLRAKENKIFLYKKYDFIEFLSTLSHEYGHFIDYNYPNRGMLGAQIASYGNRIYASSDSDYDAYRANPTEFSSFKIMDIVEKHIKKVLIEQARKKLEQLKIKLAGAKLNLDNALHDLISVEFEVLEERNFGDLPWDKQKVLFDELEQDKTCTKVQKALNDYNQAYEIYNELERFIWDIDWTLKRYDKQYVNTPSDEKHM